MFKAAFTGPGLFQRPVAIPLRRREPVPLKHPDQHVISGRIDGFRQGVRAGKVADFQSDSPLAVAKSGETFTARRDIIRGNIQSGTAVPVKGHALQRQQAGIRKFTAR